MPADVGVLRALAATRRREGRTDEAAFLLTALLGQAPDDADALNALGALLLEKGEAARALELFDRALAADAAHAESRLNRGVALRALGETDAAEAALLSVPEGLAWAASRLLAAAIMRERKADRAAVALMRDVVARAPAEGVGWNDLGIALLDLGETLAGMACLRRATALRDDAGVWLNLGNGELLIDDPRAAAEAFRRSLALSPGGKAAHNLAGCLMLLDRPADAAELYRGAAKMGGGARARFGEALAVLATGDLARGFPLYEARLELPDVSPTLPRHAARPRWRGEDINHRTLLVHAEQGYGDTVQFCRFLPALVRPGAALVVEAPILLLPILRTLAGPPRRDAITWVPTGETLPAFDLHCPMMSLAVEHGASWETLPQPPYLAPPADRVARWRPEISAGVNVGIVWAGNPGFRNDRRRSLPLDSLVPLFGAGARFHALQVPTTEADRVTLARHGVSDLGPALVDFADTAAVISLLDVVVCVDTATAHLAGALGCPVWTLLPFAADWRWAGRRADTPWYPTMRLYRQTRPGDWAGVIARVGADLAGLGHGESARRRRRPRPQPRR